jgi:hypothetical protein
MKSLDNINYLYSNEYIYQIQNRLYNFEKKYKSQLKQQTEIIIYQSWSLRKHYLLNSKCTRVNTKNLQYKNLLKSHSLVTKQIKNFIYFTVLEYILLVQSIKKSQNEIIKSSILFSQSNFLFFNSSLTNSILFFLTTLTTKEKLYYSIIKNSNLKCLKLLKNISKIENKFIFVPSFVETYEPNFSHSKGLIKTSIKKQLNSSQRQRFSKFTVFSQSSHDFFSSQNLKELKKKSYQNEKITNFFPNNKSKIKFLYIFLTGKQTQNQGYLRQVQNFGTNELNFLDNCYNLVFIKKLEKLLTLTPPCYEPLNNIFDCSTNISTYLKYKVNNVHYSLNWFLVKSKKQKINNSTNGIFHNPTLNQLTREAKIFHISFNSNFKIKYIYNLRNSLKMIELTKLKNKFKIFDQPFLIQFKTATILFTLDKYLIAVKLQNLLFFLVLLKPILETKRSQNYYLSQKNISKHETVNFLLNKLKLSSKYFIQTSSDNCLKLTSNHISSSFSTKKESLFYFELNSSQLKTLNNRLNFSSYLFTYLFKKFDSATQVTHSVYYNKGREKHLTLLFFNILIHGLPSIVKNFSLIKNKKSRFFQLNFITKTKNMTSLEQKNLIPVFKNTIYSDLPTILYSDSQIIILTETATTLSQSLKILKQFLYLGGFLQQFNKFKLGHTLFSYNKNKAGFDFLGFFISQYLKRNNTNVKIAVSEPIFNSKIVFKNSKGDKLKLLPMNKLLNLQSKTNNNLIIPIINPSKKQILIHFEKLKKIIKICSSSTQEHLIIKLSSPIRIWSYYYNTSYNTQILNYCDYLMFKLLWRWACRRHPKKNKKWIKYKYFHQMNGKNWIFGIYKSEDCYLFSLPNHIDIRFFKQIA